MSESWDKNEARRILAETAQVIDRSTTVARELLSKYGNTMDEVRELATELHTLINGLSEAEISASRKTPWIGRSQAKELLTITGQLRSMLDVAGIVKMSMDLTTQARTFIDTMNKVERHWGQDDYEEGDWEKYLTEEQLLQIMMWVEGAKNAR